MFNFNKLYYLIGLGIGAFFIILLFKLYHNKLEIMKSENKSLSSHISFLHKWNKKLNEVSHNTHKKINELRVIYENTNNEINKIPISKLDTSIDKFMFKYKS